MMSNMPLRVDEIEGWPILIAEGVPYRVVAVDRDRIVDLHILYGPANVIDVVLKRKLRRMRADHLQAMILVFRRPRSDIREGTPPIDSGIGPEVDEDDLSAQAGRRQGLRVKPPGRSTQRGKSTL